MGLCFTCTKYTIKGYLTIVLLFSVKGSQKNNYKLGGLLFVPIFKVVTHLPPVIGMTFSLGVMWGVTELMHHSTKILNQPER